MPSHYPTILIGYGGYGLRVLHDFLAEAAARGSLVWEEQGAVGSLNERRLQALSLFWIPDTLGLPEQKLPGSLSGEGGYELMDDLYSQIETVEGPRDELPKILAESVEREKRRLLDAERVRRKDMGLFGLDVIAIAQPTREEVIGAMRDLLEPCMARLAEDPSLTAAQEGGGNSLLNFLWILDFDDYWSPRAEAVRGALRHVLEEDIESYAIGLQTLGRVYLFDGTTSLGRRSADSRRREVVLLLELLLLEGIRGEPDAQTLYRRERVDVPVVCTIGVRVVERSSGLLRRLAAASFGRGWLDYMVSRGGAQEAAAPLAELADRFRGDALATVTGEAELRRAGARIGGRIEPALLEVSADQADFGERLRQTVDREVDKAIFELSGESGRQSSNLTEHMLATFRSTLEQTVTRIIQEDRPGLPVGAVILELLRLGEEFNKAAFAVEAPDVDAAPAGDPFAAAQQMQFEYGVYRGRQVQSEGMAARWWPRAAIIFAVAVTPLLLEDIGSVWPDRKASSLAMAWACAAIGAVLFWMLGRFQVQPVLERSAARARAFYVDPERGRIPERVRQIAASPHVAGRLEQHLQTLVTGLRQYALGTVAGEMHRLRTMLVKRRLEIEWLNVQINEFLVSHGVDGNGPLPFFQRGRPASDVRYSLERDEDLAAIAQSVPRNPARFRELLAIRRPFSGWADRFSDTFLHPLAFLDQLSESFKDPLELDDVETARRAQRIVNFLREEARVTICFHWLVSDGLPSGSRWSLFPRGWRTLPGVAAGVADAGFAQRVIESPNTERLYLVESVMGVPSELLVRVR